MEILQTALDKMEQSFKRFMTPFAVFFIAFPILIVTLIMYRNSNSTLFEGVSESVELGAKTHNVSNELGSTGSNNTTNGGGFPLGGKARVHNISDQNIGDGIERHNKTVSEVRDQKIQNVTAATEGTVTANNNNLSSKVGSKNDSLVVTSSTNDSTARVEIRQNEDKLLHGLLASGFHESSCLSRFQFHLYRKASPHIPSPYLISKLRNYEEIHRKCGPNTRAFDRSIVKIVRSKNNGAIATMCKYLVWTPANGLGNQMISIVATFLYAILTDRVLLVRFGKDKHGLFCEPFLNSTWILPQNSPFWNDNHVETYKSLLEKNKSNNTSKGHLPSSVFLHLQHTRDDPEKFFHCDHSQDLLKKVPLLILQSDQYFVPSLFMTPFFNSKIDKMFPEKDTIFHHLGRYLFHPSNEAWRLISGFYQKNLAKADERIGLQIRVFNPATPKQSVMELIFSCIIKNQLLPEVLGMKNSVSSSSKNKTVKAVLVASLYPEYGENLRAMYLRKPTVTGEVVEVYQASHEEHQKFNDNMHNIKAWVDMYLLSLSDVLVTTSLSTFGYVAQGLGNLRPWLLQRLAGNEKHFPTCKRDFSMEPCYHIPPKHFCNGKPIEDFASSFGYLMKCKDFSFGVKLVNGSV
ncbi:probable fucosyltransferase 8 [Lotus japonicus]|uniref:probable fucosyltransferase 8 n=1 Tax=Lotus japonicus TaxID=34305 RepID=UPI00258804FB|nr:probable fucosyltransferase 8 [Lotus japonicus]